MKGLDWGLLDFLAYLWEQVRRLWAPKAAAVREASLGRLDGNGVWWYGGEASPDAGQRALDVFEADRRLRLYGDGDKWAEAFTVLETARASDKMADLSPALAAQVSAQKRAAFDGLVKLARKVFELPPVSVHGVGWPDASVLMLLNDYVVTIAALGNEFLPLPKLPARPAESPSPQDGNSSACGLIASA